VGARGTGHKMNQLHGLSPGAALCALVFSWIGAGAAEAASPAYCALYAREYAAQFTTGSNADAAMASDYRIQEQSYYQCLNMDVEPPFPETSVYFGEDAKDVLGGAVVGAPDDTVAQGDASAGDEIAPVPVAKPKPVQTASTVRKSSGRGSGLEFGSPEWSTWCKAHFPNSFDPADGTVKPFGEARRVCK
jgi:hypothetical protein